MNMAYMLITFFYVVQQKNLLPQNILQDNDGLLKDNLYLCRQILK